MVFALLIHQILDKTSMTICLSVTGRGAVVLSFASPRKAQLFLSNAKQAKESALYLSIKDLQKFTFDDKRDRVQLISSLTLFLHTVEPDLRVTV